MNQWRELPIPPHFNPEEVDKVWRVPYQERAKQARQWAEQHSLVHAARGAPKVGLLLVDCQNTFCTPGFELFVGGRSGRGAVEDNIRLCDFVYRNLANITHITATMDTHQAVQIFHPVFWVDKKGECPEPMTPISARDLEEGRWEVNRSIAEMVWEGGGYEGLRDYARHYLRELERKGKYDLMVWPYHAMVGGIGHALVSAVEEALFFHEIAGKSRCSFEIKGFNRFTEHYSVLSPEVTQDREGNWLAERNDELIEELLSYNAVVVAGQAKSHCVAWTLEDVLEEIRRRQPEHAERFYLLEDCTSSVVVPGVVDFTDQADATFQRFAQAGMHLVKSVTPMESWPGLARQ